MLVYDETQLREPNLLVPYKSPLGLVRIANTSMSAGLRHAVIFNRFPVIHTVNGDRINTITNSVGHDFSVAPRGLDSPAVGLSGANGSAPLDELRVDTAYTLDQATIGFRLWRAAFTNGQYFGWYFPTGNLAIGVNLHADGSVRLVVANPWYTSKIATNFISASVNEIHTVTVSFAGSDVSIFIDGIEQTVTGTLNNPGVVSPGYVRLMPSGTYIGEFWVQVVCYWSRALTREEHISWHADPFQVVEAA